VRGSAWTCAGRGDGVAEATQSTVKTDNTNFISRLLKSLWSAPLMARPGPVDVDERPPDQVAVEVVADPIEVQQKTLGETVEGRLRTICLDTNLGRAAMIRGDPMVGAFHSDDHERIGGHESLLGLWRSGLV
jgi:hypothetical protein